MRVVPLLPETYYYYYYYYYCCLSCVQSVLKFGDWFAAAWATDEEKEMVFAVKLPAHNNLANCSFRLGTHPHVQPSAPALPLPSALCIPGRVEAQPTLTLSPQPVRTVPYVAHHVMRCGAEQATISTPWCIAPACSSSSPTTSRRSTAAEPARSPPPHHPLSPSPPPTLRAHAYAHAPPLAAAATFAHGLLPFLPFPHLTPPNPT